MSETTAPAPFLVEWLAAHPEVARPLEMIAREIKASPKQTARFAALLDGLDDLMHGHA